MIPKPRVPFAFDICAFRCEIAESNTDPSFTVKMVGHDQCLFSLAKRKKCKKSLSII